MAHRSQTKYNITATIYDKRGRVLSVGKNSYVKTHPVQKDLSDKYGNGEQIFLHAEVDAIIRLNNPEKAYKIVVERYDRDGKPQNAKPCKLCQKFIEAIGLKRIEYTTGG